MKWALVMMVVVPAPMRVRVRVMEQVAGLTMVRVVGLLMTLVRVLALRSPNLPPWDVPVMGHPRCAMTLSRGGS